MKKIYKVIGIRIAILLIAFTSTQKVLANASQPGIWNAGGTVFTMLYPEDSLTFKKVQMVEEKIYIQLYKGYAVVKGTYFFHNTTEEVLHFKMGYPVNGIYAGGGIDLNQVKLDSLSRFKIKTKNQWLPLLKEEHPELNHDYRNTIPSGDNWMVWQMTFAPAESQMVEVYFIVNTNEAGISKGYNNERKNALIYLLESGNVWRQPIKKGSFYVQLMNGLITKDINGLSQGFGFRYNETQRLFAGMRTNFSPTPKDNLLITYYQRNEHFVFDKALLHAENLFTKIDELSSMPFETLTYTEIQTGDPYEVKSTFGGAFPALLTLLIVFAPFIIGFIVVIIIIWAVVKRMNFRDGSNG